MKQQQRASAHSLLEIPVIGRGIPVSICCQGAGSAHRIGVLGFDFIEHAHFAGRAMRIFI